MTLPTFSKFPISGLLSFHIYRRKKTRLETASALLFDGAATSLMGWKLGSLAQGVGVLGALAAAGGGGKAGEPQRAGG